MEHKPESLSEFLDRREAEIKGLRAQLLTELKQIKSAKAAIQKDVTSSPTDNDQTESKVTIKQMILDVLRKAGKPKTSEEIIALIAGQFGTEIARTSLSPQLSRLRHQDRQIEYDEDNSTWRLPDMPTRDLGAVAEAEFGNDETSPW